MIWIQIHSSPFSTHSKITQALRISKAKKFNSTISFKNTYTDVVRKVINNLNVAKSCQINDVPTKVIKINKDIFANFITYHFNYCIAYGEFAD